LSDGAPRQICLNMIVRNEAAIMERCLRSVADHVACWVISDTGSTDGTPALIERLAARGIPGELHHAPFHDFAQARNAALRQAHASALRYDYLLLTDADMELVVADPSFRGRLAAGSYEVLQRSGISYWNTRLLRRDVAARYQGVTHEYLEVPQGGERLEGIRFIDYACGSNRADKLGRDLRLLQVGLAREPENARYQFYLAQTYRDLGQAEGAAAAYGRRADMGGWAEEAWYARWQQARSLLALGDEDGFLRHALAAYNARPHRAETLYDLSRFHRERSRHEVALLHAEAGLALPYPQQDSLFIDDFVYATGLREEISISGFYTRSVARRMLGSRCCATLAVGRAVPEASRSLARHNLSFYAEAAAVLLPSFNAHRLPFVAPRGFFPLNPSVCVWQNSVWVLQRCTNYRLTDEGWCETPGGVPVRNRNFLLRLDDALQIRMSEEVMPPLDLPPSRFGQVLGFEDSRLFVQHNMLWCASNVRELNAQGWYEIVLSRIDHPGSGRPVHAEWKVLTTGECHKHEKNWMPVLSGREPLFVYSVDPTLIVDESGSVCSQSTTTPALDNLRGGSQLVPFDDGWLAVVHEVEFLYGNAIIFIG
jgi:glycosyltransferase involved in cell wall biosynthesis